MEIETTSGPVGGGQHTFTISVFLQGAGANYGDDLAPQKVLAYNLDEALAKARELPLSAWFPSEEADVK